MGLTQIQPEGLSKPVDLADNDKIRLGTGNDLEIFHDGSNSVIRENGTGDLYLQNGITNKLRVHSSGVSVTGGLSIDGATVFNESGANVDFRIEGDNNANLFFVDAGNDRIGIKESAPSTTLHISGAEDSTIAYFDTDFSLIRSGKIFSGKVTVTNIFDKEYDAYHLVSGSTLYRTPSEPRTLFFEIFVSM